MNPGANIQIEGECRALQNEPLFVTIGEEFANLAQFRFPLSTGAKLRHAIARVVEHGS